MGKIGIRTVTGILFIMAGVANVVKFLLLGTYINILLAAACIAFGALDIIRRGAPSHKGLIASRTIALLVCAYIGIGMSSPYGRIGLYGSKLRYAEASGYSVGHFPDLKEGLRLTDMQYMPSVMQGSGWVYAGIECSAERLAHLEKDAAERAQVCFTLDGYLTGTIPEDRMPWANDTADDERSWDRWYDKHIYVHLSERMMDASGHDTAVYIIYSNYYSDHIRTDAVIVDRTDGYIEYVGM